MFRNDYCSRAREISPTRAVSPDGRETCRSKHNRAQSSNIRNVKTPLAASSGHLLRDLPYDLVYNIILHKFDYGSALVVYLLLYGVIIVSYPSITIIECYPLLPWRNIEMVVFSNVIIHCIFISA